MVDSSDVVIIGAGVAGNMIARELSKYQLRVTVVEKLIEAGFGTSKASSSIVHPEYGVPGSMIAKHTVKSNPEFERLAEELSIDFRRIGEIFVALSDEEVKVLEQTVNRAKTNGVFGFEWLTRDAVLKKEPNVSQDVVAGVIAPSAGFVYPFDLVTALFENAQDNGVKYYFNTELLNITEFPEYLLLETNQGHLMTRYLVNAAGLHADEVGRLVGDLLQFRPERGQSIILDKRTGNTINHIIRGCPAGVMIPTHHGNIFLGTTRENEMNRNAECFSTKEGVERVFGINKRLIPKLDQKDIITSFVGLRVRTEDDNHIIRTSENCKRVLHVCITSPGVTNSPEIAKEALSKLAGMGLGMETNGNYNPYRTAIPHFNALSEKEQEELIKKDPRYGRVICRCESITEGEIVEAIRRGAKTLDGVKCRVRAGMGRCQGGFCTPRVMEVLSRELGVEAEHLTKFGGHSSLVTNTI